MLFRDYEITLRMRKTVTIQMFRIVGNGQVLFILLPIFFRAVQWFSGDE
jgi:hypothetical protein